MNHTTSPLVRMPTFKAKEVLPEDISDDQINGSSSEEYASPTFAQSNTNGDNTANFGKAVEAAVQEA